MTDDRTHPRPSPPLTPPMTQPPRPGPRPGASPLTWLAFGFGALLLLAAAVFWGLPRLLLPEEVAVADDAPAVASQQAAPAPSSPVAAGAVERQRARREAEAALARLLKLQARLLDAGVERWAASEYDASLDHLARGDSLFEAGEFGGALTAYEGVEDTFEALENSRPERLAAALRLGAGALAADDVAVAIEQYGIAAALDPGNREAAEGLARAERRVEVLAHMKTGRAQFGDGALEAARDAFRAALALDPAYAPARSALREVETAITEIAFSRAMSAVFEALERGEFDRAERALARARALKPGAEEIGLAAQRLESDRESAALSRLRSEAERQVADEAWAEAVATYEKALAIDPSVAFAVQGHERARRRAALDAAFERYLNDPERIYSPEPLRQAEKVLEASAAVENPGPRLEAQRDSLSRLIEAARMPLAVSIVSDGQTEVTVFALGSLGRFTEKQLMLRPGDYVVLGTRRGYRDVRHELSVRPGQPPDPIVVICREMV